MGLDPSQHLERDDDNNLFDIVQQCCFPLNEIALVDVPVSTLPVRSNLILNRSVPFHVESQPFELHCQASSLRIESPSVDLEFLAPNRAFSAGIQHATLICAQNDVKE